MIAIWTKRRKLGEPVSALCLRIVAATAVALLHPVMGADTAGVTDSTQKNVLAPLGTCRRIVRMLGHTRPVESIAVSSCGRYVLSGSTDRTVRLWDVRTGKERRRFKVDGDISRIALSRDGKLFAWSGFGGKVSVHDIASGEVRLTHSSHAKAVRTITFSPDGECVISGGLDGTVRVWDIKTNSERFCLTHDTRVLSLSCSTDGRRLLSGVYGLPRIPDPPGPGRLSYWDLGTGKLIRRWDGHTSSVVAVALCPRGEKAVSVGREQTLRMWRVPDGQQLHSWELTGRVIEVALSTDGEYVLTGSFRDESHNNRGVVELWVPSSERPVARIVADRLSVSGVAFLPDARHVVIACAHDRAIDVWEVPKLGAQPGRKRPSTQSGKSPNPGARPGEMNSAKEIDASAPNRR